MTPPVAAATRRRSDPEARRAELTAAAVRAIRTVGADASMADIAAEAGISKPVLYTHFGDKAGLGAAVAEWYLGDLGRMLDEIFDHPDDPGAAVRDVIDLFAHFAEREPSLYRFLVAGAEGTGRETCELPGLPALAAQVASFLVTSFDATDSAAVLELKSFALMGGVFEGVGWWLAHPTMTREELVDALTEVVLHGVAS